MKMDIDLWLFLILIMIVLFVSFIMYCGNVSKKTTIKFGVNSTLWIIIYFAINKYFIINKHIKLSICIMVFAIISYIVNKIIKIDK